NYFSLYDMGRDEGIVHFAERKKLKGAKFFIWGNDPRGESWNKALTNDGSQYIEIQSGPFESQGVYKFLKPHQEITWSEYWYPVNGMSGIKYAEKELALNLESLDQGIEFKLQAME